MAPDDGRSQSTPYTTPPRRLATRLNSSDFTSCRGPQNFSRGEHSPTADVSISESVKD